jgi:hypothetical protein
MRGLVARRQHAAGGGDLDHVGALADERANGLAHLLGPIDHRRGYARVPAQQRDHHARREPIVAMTAGLADHRQRDLQARAGDEAVLLRPLDAKVGAAGVAHAGDAHAERRRHVACCLEELVRERPLDDAPVVDVTQRQVDVAVEQPRQQRPAGDVDAVVAIEAAANLHDAAALDGDVGRRRICAATVEDQATAKDQARI